MSEAVAPSTYVWEPTSDELAARTGLPKERIVRFDMNTRASSPALAAAVLSRPFDPGLSEYPPSDYAPLVEAAAGAYGVAIDEVLPTAGADEALDLAARAFLHEGSIAVSPTPTYAMYRVVTEQRGARFEAVPRMPRRAGFGIDMHALRAAARTARVVWLCEPNNPTGSCEPPARIALLLDELAADARDDGRQPPIVVMDEAYAEFAGETVLPLRYDHPELVVVRTMSKAYGLAGIRVGFAIAQPVTLAPILAYRAPSSVSTPSAAVAAAALRRPDILASAVEETVAERRRLAGLLMDAGWQVGPSEASFVLVRFGSPEAAEGAAEALLERGLVARTFGPGHPLASCLRLTVRSVEEDDRLVAAAREIRA